MQFDSEVFFWSPDFNNMLHLGTDLIDRRDLCGGYDWAMDRDSPERINLARDRQQLTVQVMGARTSA